MPSVTSNVSHNPSCFHPPSGRLYFHPSLPSNNYHPISDHIGIIFIHSHSLECFVDYFHLHTNFSSTFFANTVHICGSYFSFIFSFFSFVLHCNMGKIRNIARTQECKSSDQDCDACDAKGGSVCMESTNVAGVIIATMN